MRVGHLPLLCLVALAFGCQREALPAPTTPVTAGAEAVELVDQAGRTVKLEQPARRVVSLAPSHTEIVFAIGAGDRLVGRTPACDHPPAAAAVEPVGQLFPPSYERIVGARPDLVLMLDGQVDVRRRLEGLGLTVAVVQPRTLPEVAAAMRLVGGLIGVDAEPAATAFEEQLAAATRSSGPDSLRVFYEVGSDPIFGAGPTSFIGDLVRRAGGRNALTGDAAWPRLTTEQLIAADPQVIITGGEARRQTVLAGPPGWKTIAAVRAGSVHAVPDADVLARPGPRVIEGLRWMAGVLEARR